MTERIFTPEQVAFDLSVRRQQVYRWIRSGRLRALRLGGGQRLRIRESAIRDFLGLPPENPFAVALRPPTETITDGPARLREARMLLKQAGLGRGFGR